MAELAEAALAGAVGWTVRCTPLRRTVMVERPGGAVFVKIRREGGRRARAEVRWLQRLAGSGFRVPEPLAVDCRGGFSLIALARVPGRPLDALLREALAEGRQEEAFRHAREVVAPMVRRLHASGICFRDLYWNHLFAESLDPGAGEPALIDVERALRVRWRSFRWRVKDLAGLWSSWPGAPDARSGLRWLQAYLGGLPPGWRRLARAVLAKAARIRRHRPRYG